MSVTLRTVPSLARLEDRVAGRVIGPEDADYDNARAAFFRTFDRRPAAVVQAIDVDDVAAVVSLAREEGLELAVRSGGHSVAGHSATDGGIVLDLSLLKEVEVDPERRIARAQTGLTAGELTAVAAEHGLGISLGDTGSVGLGGLTLGGGIGYLVRKHGLTIDNLLGAELVTADGELVRADDDHHPELYWAIRGGGGNFGVATRFEYRLVPVDSATGGMLILPATPETVASFVEAAEEAPDELSTIANVMPAPPLPFIPAEHRGRPIVLAMLLHVGPHDAGQRALAPFRSIAEPIADMLRPMSYPEIYPPDEGDQRPLSTGSTLFLDTVDRDVAREILDRLRASTALMSVVQLRVLGGAMARVPADATAFAHRGSRIMANVAALYGRPEETPTHETWVANALAALRQADSGAYVNFLGDESDRVRAAYPDATWNRLAAVKRRYDPTNVFRLNHNIPPEADPRG